MTETRKDIAYLVQRVHDYVRRRKPTGYARLTPVAATVYVSTSLGRYGFWLYGDGRTYIFLGSTIYMLADENGPLFITRADEHGFLFTDVLPALENALVLDDLASL
ncbi:MAG: hypothetical protein AB7L09_02325 [Nitrospira sp.]